MISRSLEILFKNGYKHHAALPDFDGSELNSAREFVQSISKFSSGLLRLMQRNPPVVKAPKAKKYNTIDDLLHAVVNCRKHVDAQQPLPLYHAQLFSIDLVNGTMTFHKSSNGSAGLFEERGTMSIKNPFSNWEMLFYEQELVDESKPNPADKYKEKMKEALCGQAFDLWSKVMYEMEAPKEGWDHLEIKYSGGGDSGDIDSIEYVYHTYVPVDEDSDEKEKVCDSIGVNDADFDSLVTPIWNLIDTRESGFENNDGGFGNIKIGPSKFEWYHENYYTDSETTVSEEVNL